VDIAAQAPKPTVNYAFNTSINASCGMFTLPMDFMRFYFSSNLRLHFRRFRTNFIE
jgi:hypothetical protein